MKKVLVVLLTLLVFTGCSSKAVTTTVSDGDTPLYEYPDGTVYTKQANYEKTKELDVSLPVIDTVVERIAKFEGIDTDAIEKMAEDDVNSMIEAGYSEFIYYYYASVEDYIKEFKSYEILVELKQKSVNDELETYVNDYKPYKASVIYVDSKEIADKIVEQATSGNSTFAYACSSNGYTATVDEVIYTKVDDSMPTEVTTWINDNETGISPVIQVDEVTTDSEGNSLTTPRYYIVNLISKNVEDFKDDFTYQVATDLDDTTIINNLLKKYDLAIHDQRIYDLLSSQYEAIK